MEPAKTLAIVISAKTAQDLQMDPVRATMTPHQNVSMMIASNAKQTATAQTSQSHYRYRFLIAMLITTMMQQRIMPTVLTIPLADVEHLIYASEG
jgi:hypothetical protein